MTNLSVNEQRRALVKAGKSIAGLSDADVKQAYQAHVLTNAAPFEAPAFDDVPQESGSVGPSTSSVHVDSATPDDLVNTFMNDGKGAFTKQLRTVIESLTHQVDNLQAQNDVLTLDYEAAKSAQSQGAQQVITRVVDANGKEIIPDVIINAVGERKACEIWQDLPSDAVYTVPCFDYEPPVKPAHYDMHQMHVSGTLALVALAQKKGRAVWLAGEKGTGKTTFGQYFAYSTGRPFFRISHTKSMEAQELIGGFLMPDGKTEWADGQLTQAIKTPHAVILLDEPTRNPDALEIYQTLMDEGYLDIAATGERVYTSEGVTFLATDNTDGAGDATGRYHGTFSVNQAFRDRFSFTVTVGYLSPKREAALLQRTGIRAEAAKHLVTYANRMRDMASHGEVEEPVSFRRLEAIAEAMVSGIPQSLALETALFSQIEHEQDKEAYRTNAQAHLPSLTP